MCKNILPLYGLLITAFFTETICEERGTSAITLSSSNLPILLINTYGKVIPDIVRIPAHLEIKYRSDGSRNLVDDPSAVSVKIAIEIRGSSSAYFDKKSYGFETQDDSGGNLNISLLDMPDENDWILHGPYSDKSLIRNSLIFRLARSMGRYASRTRFCELVVNGKYQGLYLLMEKIKRDKNRVGIADLMPHDRDGEAVTGGYIIKVDKRDTNPPGWTSPSRPPVGGTQIFFQYVYPRADQIAPEQNRYIQNYIYEFEAALNGANYRDGKKGYLPYVDELSFVDFMIINELTKNIDAYRFSTFMYKDRGGPLTMGPVWDFDLGFGNVDYGNERAMHPDGWMYDQGGGRMYWWPRMMQNYRFKLLLSRRWYELRRGPFSNSSVLATVDSLTTLLNEAQQRNFTRWPVLGRYLWPNFYVGQTWEDELDYLKQWIMARLEWMDDHMPYPEQTTVDRIPAQTADPVVAFPNPFCERVIFRLPPADQPRELTIFNLYGKAVRCFKINESGAAVEVSWDGSDTSFQSIAAGPYFYRLLEQGKPAWQGKLVRLK